MDLTFFSTQKQPFYYLSKRYLIIENSTQIYILKIVIKPVFLKGKRQHAIPGQRGNKAAVHPTLDPP